MANYCLPEFAATKFLNALRSGDIDPAELAQMSSAARRQFFAGIVGESEARQVNALFEAKLLLKNQQRGLVTWAKQLTGITPETRRELLDRVQKMDRILDPEDGQFLEDLAAKRLGVDVTQEEARIIARLAKEAETTKQAWQAGTGDRLDYGRAKVRFSNYIADLKLQAEKPATLGEKLNPWEAANNIAGQAKSIKASLDLSALFRQNWKTMFTNPGIWMKNGTKMFKNAWDTFGGKAVMDEINADIVSRPTYDLMKKAKLAIGNVEEAFPSSAPEKIPGLGRFFKASQDAYTGMQYQMRADIFDKMIDVARKSGVDLNKTQLESIGKLVNSLTGRGNLGPLEGSANAFNNLFFSPRFLKANIDVLTAHQFDKNVTPFVRKQAAMNLVKVVVGTAFVMKLAEMLWPDSIEWDPRSSDFGKVVIGNTRFDVSGGMGSLAVLASRLVTQETKSTKSGALKKLNTGEFGSKTSIQVLTDFFENKLSPTASTLKNILVQEDRSGQRPTVVGELTNLFVPIPITNYFEVAKDPKAAPLMGVIIADFLGIGTNTYDVDAPWPKKETDPRTLEEIIGKPGDGISAAETEDTGTRLSLRDIPNLAGDAAGDLLRATAPRAMAAEPGTAPVAAKTGLGDVLREIPGEAAKLARGAAQQTAKGLDMLLNPPAPEPTVVRAPDGTVIAEVPAIDPSGAVGAANATVRTAARSLPEVRSALTEMYKRAPAAKEALDALADDIAARVGGTVAKTVLKGQARAEEKVMKEYLGDPTRLTDLVRNTIVVNTRENLNRTLDELAGLPDTVSTKLVQRDSDFLGYAGGMAKVRAGDMVGEIQVNTPWLIFGKEPENVARAILGDQAYDDLLKKVGGRVQGGLGHKFYEEWRSLPIEEQLSEAGMRIADRSKAYYTLIDSLF